MNVATLKVGITSILHGNIVKEQTTVLDYVNAVLNYNYIENKLSCLAQNLAPAHVPVPTTGCRLNSQPTSTPGFRLKFLLLLLLLVLAIPRISDKGGCGV